VNEFHQTIAWLRRRVLVLSAALAGYATLLFSLRTEPLAASVFGLLVFLFVSNPVHLLTRTPRPVRLERLRSRVPLLWLAWPLSRSWMPGIQAALDSPVFDGYAREDPVLGPAFRELDGVRSRQVTRAWAALSAAGEWGSLLALSACLAFIALPGVFGFGVTPPAPALWGATASGTGCALLGWGAGSLLRDPTPQRVRAARVCAFLLLPLFPVGTASGIRVLRALGNAADRPSP